MEPAAEAEGQTLHRGNLPHLGNEIYRSGAGPGSNAGHRGYQPEQVGPELLLSCVVLYSVLQCIVLYCNLLYGSILNNYCIVLYSVLYRSILNCIVLYSVLCRSILTNYDLELKVDDGRCSTDIVMKRFIDLLRSRGTIQLSNTIGLLGKHLAHFIGTIYSNS